MFQLPINGSDSSEKEQRPPPALLQPLSLQQSSIYCIVTNLEKYPPDLLALLSLHFRRELLLLLPPADIFQLEQTKVVEGIDMENEIWKVVSERFDYKVARTAHTDCNELVPEFLGSTPPGLQRVECLSLPHNVSEYMSSPSPPNSWRSRFVSCLVSFLFHMTPFEVEQNHSYICHQYSGNYGNRNYLIFLQLLFCNRFFKLKQLTDVGGFPLQASEVTLVPSRYSRFYTLRDVNFDWMQFLLENCHIQPPHCVSIDLQQLPKGTTNIENKSFQMVLPCVDSLTLHLSCEYFEDVWTHAEHPKAEDFPQYLRLYEILTSCSQLKNVTITQHVFSNDVFRRLVVDRAQFDKVLKKCFLHPPLDYQSFLLFNSNNVEFFKGLKCIHIDAQVTQIDLSTFCSLLVFVQNEGFESFSVTGTTMKEDKVLTKKIMQTLEHSFSSPISSTCELISLTGMEQLPFSFLFWLLSKFLYSSSTIPQKMVISGCLIDYTVIPSEKELKSIPHPPNLVNSHKSLHLPNFPYHCVFVNSLSHLPSVVLDELHVDYTSPRTRSLRDEHVPRITASAMLHTLATSIPLCRIKSLSFQFIKDVYESVGTLNSVDTVVLSSLVKTVQAFPDTAVSLQCKMLTGFMDAFLGFLCNEGQMSGGSFKFVDLCIDFLYFESDKTSMTHFQTLLESIPTKYPIDKLVTKNTKLQLKRKEVVQLW